jgi:hypothetical protein
VLTAGKIPDPWDIETLRQKDDYDQPVNVRKVLTEMSARRPSPQDFVRAHPEVPAVKLTFIEDKRDRELYLIPPELRDALARFCIAKHLHLAVNRQGVPFFWPVTAVGRDGKDFAAWRSTREAIEQAKTKWIQIMWNKGESCYEVWTALDDLGDPVWPELTYKELVKLAFSGKRIDDLDHPVVKMLRGQL